MNQQIKTSLGVIIILIIAVTVGVFVWKAEKGIEIAELAQNIEIKPKIIQNKISLLLIRLNEEMNKPTANLDSIREFLLNKYGPCWGIPEGQCRE